MGRIPVHAAAHRTPGKPLVASINKKWHQMHSRAARYIAQRLVASGAAAEKLAPRLNRVGRKHLANLLANEVALDKKNVARRAQAAIARKKHAILAASKSQELISAQLWSPDHVSAQKPKPPRQTCEHPVSGKFRLFSHGPGKTRSTTAAPIARRLKFSVPRGVVYHGAGANPERGPKVATSRRANSR
jgi:hypothetical protein